MICLRDVDIDSSPVDPSLVSFHTSYQEAAPTRGLPSKDYTLNEVPPRTTQHKMPSGPLAVLPGEIITRSNVGGHLKVNLVAFEKPCCVEEI